jgi:hypothetical protein
VQNRDGPRLRVEMQVNRRPVLASRTIGRDDRKKETIATSIAQGPMPSQTKSRQLATNFDKAYPKSLSKRLEWWCHVLGIHRSRIIQLMGLSADEAKRAKDVSWSDLLKKKEREENAWCVEGKLHELLALFDYDCNALADRLHHPREAQKQESSRVTRQKGDIVKLQYVPSNDGTEILLDHARGGDRDRHAVGLLDRVGKNDVLDERHSDAAGHFRAYRDRPILRAPLAHDRHIGGRQRLGLVQ